MTAVVAEARIGAVRPHLDGRRTCSCGQELDVCHHGHCPRCGHRLAGRTWPVPGPA